jgi:hypothetical protein
VQYVAENALFHTWIYFQLNCGDMSDKHAERFHQDISVMEHRYKGKWSFAMLGDYCWMMKRDAPEKNTIDRPKGHVVKVSNFLFIFIVHITMIVLLFRKQELTNEFRIIFAFCGPKKHEDSIFT